MVLALSIKDGFYKIEKSIIRPNYVRYETNVKEQNKIIRFKKIYKFYFDHFLIKCTVFVLNVKNVIKIQKLNFWTNSATYKKNVKEQNCSFQKDVQILF